MPVAMTTCVSSEIAGPSAIATPSRLARMLARLSGGTVGDDCLLSVESALNLTMTRAELVDNATICASAWIGGEVDAASAKQSAASVRIRLRADDDRLRQPLKSWQTGLPSAFMDPDTTAFRPNRHADRAGGVSTRG